jgi:hypothetical protein
MSDDGMKIVVRRGAVRSYERGELGFEGIRILRWGMAGQVAIYAVLALTAFFGWP